MEKVTLIFVNMENSSYRNSSDCSSMHTTKRRSGTYGSFLHERIGEYIPGTLLKRETCKPLLSV